MTDVSAYLQRRLGEEDAVIGNDSHGHSVQLGEPGDHRRPVQRLELVEAALVHDAGDDLMATAAQQAILNRTYGNKERAA